MSNRLVRETSPYLLQHAQNPVDWYPWGHEALERARREDRPIFLSIGYSACHWCHVMEHESFENPTLAAQLNENFVPIKVDREERPDLDQIYMQAVQTLTGRGGWPMSVFLTPDLKPFYGGTYWPPQARMGMPGFDQVLAAVSNAWQNQRSEVLDASQRLTAQLASMGQLPTAQSSLSQELLTSARQSLLALVDRRNGGFGGAPKFPHPIDLRVLLRLWRRERSQTTLDMARLTLDKMAAGGIYDHLGGGFHRYSVDERWLVPHFEKMLYDNALLAPCYLEAFQATGEPRYAAVVRETLDYVLREMCDPAGGFYSTQDADSEGVEGKFYVWSPAEIVGVLGEERARAFAYVYDVSEVGNFEGQNILNRPKTLEQCAQVLHRDPVELAAEIADGRARLLTVRGERVAPGLDDKVLVSWNGLMISALAQAGSVLSEPRYIAAAAAAARFILTAMRSSDGRLLHSYRHGQARLAAYLDDYACLADALVMLYEADFDETWITEAVALADTILAEFADREQGGFFYTAHDHEKLVARPKDVQDSSVPSATAMTVTVLLRLAKLCGRSDYFSAAEQTLAQFADLIGQHPTAVGQMLIALDFYLGPTPELALVGGDAATTAAILAELRRRFWPSKVVAQRPSRNQAAALADLFAGKEAQRGEPTLFVCENFACREPIVGQAAIVAEFERLTS